MLEKFYLRHLPASPEIERNLQTGISYDSWEKIDPSGEIWEEMHGNSKK